MIDAGPAPRPRKKSGAKAYEALAPSFTCACKHARLCDAARQIRVAGPARGVSFPARTSTLGICATRALHAKPLHAEILFYGAELKASEIWERPASNDQVFPKRRRVHISAWKRFFLRGRLVNHFYYHLRPDQGVHAVPTQSRCAVDFFLYSPLFLLSLPGKKEKAGSGGGGGGERLIKDLAHLTT